MNSFYRMIESHGGLINIAKLTRDEAWCAHTVLNVCSTIKELYNNSDKFTPLGDVQFELVDNNTLNAFAHYDGDYEGIGIYSGLLGLLIRRSENLWSEKGRLAAVHAHRMAEPWVKHCFEQKDMAKWSTKWQPASSNLMSEEERSQRHLNTALTALVMVLTHEVGHLVNAHIPLLGHLSSVSLKTLYEHGNIGDLASRELHYCELDADQYAIWTVINLAMSARANGGSFLTGIPKTDDGVFAHLVDIFRAVAITYCCMDEGSTSRSLEPESFTTHPAPGLRLAGTAIAAALLLEPAYGIPKTMTFLAAALGAVECGYVYSDLGLPAPTMENEWVEMWRAAHKKKLEMKEWEIASLGSVKEKLMDLRIARLGKDPLQYKTTDMRNLPRVELVD